MADLRIGVIGTGGRGSLAKYAHQPAEGTAVVAGADILPAVEKPFRDFYGAEAFFTADYKELLNRDLDAIFVTSPDFCHEEHALATLNAGISVYLEKPMAITIAGCDRILEAARRTGAKLYLGHNMRHFASVRKMKQLIDTGAIGEVKTGWCRHFIGYGGDAYFKDWHADRTKSTGLLLQKGAHDIDVLHWLCGGYTRRVVAMGAQTLYHQITDRHSPESGGSASWSNDHWPPLSQKQLHPVLDVEDLNMMLMELDNGVFCSYQQCHYTPDAWRNYTIIGSEGRIENFGDSGCCNVKLWNKRRDGFIEANQTFELEPEEGGHGGADDKIVAEFIRFLREGIATSTSPVAARYSVAAGCMATQSLRDGSRPKDIPPLPPLLEDYFVKGQQPAVAMEK